MPKSQIAFHPDGVVEYTRDPIVSRFFEGRGKMVRITDIQKSDMRDAYHILWLHGPFAGQLHTLALSETYNVAPPPFQDLYVSLPVPETILSFVSYEAAVRYEVTVLRAMRLAGVRFDGCLT